jgi:hypothetical protein
VTPSGSATLTAQYDDWKFVRWENEYGEEIRGATCRANGVINGSVLTASGSTAVDGFRANFPTKTGRYLFCYRRSGTTLWYRVPTAASDGNPFRVENNRITFRVTPTGTWTASGTHRVAVTDAYPNETHLAQGGSLAGGDTVYYVDQHDMCGGNPTTADQHYLYLTSADDGQRERVPVGHALLQPRPAPQRDGRVQALPAQVAGRRVQLDGHALRPPRLLPDHQRGHRCGARRRVG